MEMREICTEKCFTVYMHVSPNNKRYIGITSKKPEHRWNSGRGYMKNKYFFEAIMKYGWDNFQHVIIAEKLSKEEACNLEKSLIAGCKTTDPTHGYNMSAGGESGTYGAKLSREFREKARKRMIGELNPNYGKKFSEETIRKLSKVRKGKFSPKQREALCIARSKHMRKVICLNTGIVYDSIAYAAMMNNTSSRGIRSVCNGEYSHTHGMRWAYYDGKDSKRG